MRKTTKALIIMNVMAISLMIMSSPSFAPEIERPPVRLRTEADLGITAIFASNCKCDLSDVDALYMGDISVDIGKKDIRVSEESRREPGRVAGFLTVTYHDLLAGRSVTQTLMLQNNIFTGGVGTIRVVRNPVLVKKSMGIRAEIRLNSPGYADVDPNSGNNVMIVKDCQIMLR
jgi:hypothetical protein